MEVQDGCLPRSAALNTIIIVWFYQILLIFISNSQARMARPPDGEDLLLIEKLL